MSLPFDAGSLDRDYAFLDDCPEHLFEVAVTLPVGDLRDRVAGVLAWQSALLAGHLPPDDCWPPAHVAGPVRLALAELDIPRFCKGEPDLVDELMVDILAAFSGQTARYTSEVLELLRELERLERRRLQAEQEAAEASKKRKGKAGKAKLRRVRLDEETLARLRAKAERTVAERDVTADRSLLDGWSERASVWSQIADVFGDLGGLLGRGWNLAQGILRHVGWSEVVRLAELVKRLPELQEIVRVLGRLQVSDADVSVSETLFEPVRRLEEELREVPTPHVPAETRGVRRSGEISRMLPVEAAMLGHPKLKLLWHARRAERALLTYRVEGMEFVRHLVERETLEAREQERPRPERGPIIAVLDTSGSMHGVPEQVAKALVLEALRVAHSERRRCYLYAFSGPGDITEHELDLSADGLGRLLQFLGMSFHGGTDLDGPLRMVLTRLEDATWKKADVLLVSDGDWSVGGGVVRRVDAAREDGGTRFHGVLVGSRGQVAMSQVCDPVHVFGDWDAVVRG